MNKKFLSLALTLSLSAGLAAPAFAAGATFPDVPSGSWAHPYVEQAAELGFVSGYADGRFGPNDPVTYAQLSVMLTQGFFRAQVQSYTGSKSPWYLAYTGPANELGLFDGTALAGGGYADKALTEGQVNRYEMAQILCNALEAAGVDTSADLARAEATTEDWDAIPAQYRQAVAVAKAAGLISGTNDAGRFDGQGQLSRAQSAVILVAANQAIQNAQTTPADPDPVTPDPVTPDPVTPGSSPVGTMSDTPVTLSLETHAPVVDYWSSQSAEVKALVDQRVFNAAVQSMRDAEMVIEDGRQGTTWKDKAVNPYYNYATCDSASKGVSLVSDTLGASRINACGDYFYSVTYNVTKNVYAPVKDSDSDKLAEVFAPIFTRFPANATDRQKVEICMKEIADRFDYVESGGGFDWLNGKTQGNCMSFAYATENILAAAGIPTYHVVGHANGGAHAWTLAYVDGDWYYVDGTDADSGWTYGPQEIEAYNEGTGARLDKSEQDRITVFKALVEASLS